MVVLQLHVPRGIHLNPFQEKLNSRYKVYVSNSYMNQQRSSGNSRVVTMVEPLEAKRLAAEDMERLKAMAKLKRRRVIEATNGGWAVLGLTFGIVIEAYTGKSIASQITGYVEACRDILTEAIAKLHIGSFQEFKLPF